MSQARELSEQKRNVSRHRRRLLCLHIQTISLAIYSNNSNLTITKMYFILFNSELSNVQRRVYSMVCGYVCVCVCVCAWDMDAA